MLTARPSREGERLASVDRQTHPDEEELQRAMKVSHYEVVTQKPVEMEGAKGCSVRWLVGPEQDAPNFAMRQFEVAAGGHTPRHRHPYEHEVFVLEGTRRSSGRGCGPSTAQRRRHLRASRRSAPVPQHG